MKPILAMSLLSILASVTGCQTIPPITTKRATYDSSYPIGGTNIEVDNVEVTDTKITIGKYKRVSKWGWFGQTVTVEGYSRDRKPGEEAKIDAP